MSVIVEFENGYPVKKCSVKITPSMSIQSISQQACSSLNLNPPEAYVLCLKKQTLQGSLSVRLAGLSNGSKLNLVYRGISHVKEQVTIALQTEEAGRLIDKFNSDTSLWDILLHFEVKNGLNLTRRCEIPNTKKSFFQSASTPLYAMPVCVFMNKEYSTIAALRATTLRDLGLESGSAAIRLLNQIKENPLSFYLEEIENYAVKDIVQKPVESKTIPMSNENEMTPLENTPILENLIPDKVETPINAEKKESTSIREIQVESEIPTISPDLVVYKPVPDGAGSLAIELPPSFFTLSSTELKMMIDSQRSKLNTMDNRPLMTQAMREREEKLKQEKYPKTLIRIRFPDRYSIQFTFYSGALVSELYESVSDCLVGSKPFRLFISPPVVDLDPKKTFWSQKLAPASLVYIRYDSSDETPRLKPSLVEAAQDYPVPSPEIPVSLETSDAPNQDIVQDDTAGTSKSRIINALNPSEPASFNQSSSDGTDNIKKPKWFRLR